MVSALFFHYAMWIPPGQSKEENKMAKDRNYRDFSYRTPFNNRPIEADEELVPVVLNDDNRSYLRQHGLDWNNVETWHFPRPVPVAFVPNKVGNMDVWMKWFNSEVKLYLQHSSEVDSEDLSLDQFLEDIDDEDSNGFDPTGNTKAEDEFRTNIILDLLIEELSPIDENMGKVFKLLYEDYSGREILEMIDLKKGQSQGYEFIAKTRKTAQELYRKYYL